MSKPETKNLAASVHQKLLNKARETNRPFNEVLQYHAIERFLYRLSCSPFAEKFTLKGALLFNAWGLSGLRPTRDIDLLGHTTNMVEQIAAIFREVCTTPVIPDGWVFDAATVRGERIKEDAIYEGVRVVFTGLLGKSRVSMQIDIGFGDIVAPAPLALTYPVLLDFPHPTLSGYPRETVIAEKFQAMVALGEINSRMKDFYDIFALVQSFDFDGQTLQASIEQTFMQRGTDLPADTPIALTEGFALGKTAQWQAFQRRINADNAEDFMNVIERLRDFLLPPVQASLAGKMFAMHWQRGAGWT